VSIKRFLFLCFVPVFFALSFLGVPPPVLMGPRPQQQEQGETLRQD
jgi:hypothetical protein